MPAYENYFHAGHLWCRGDAADGILIGLSAFAQSSLGEIVYLELPEVGTEVSGGEPMGTVESVKVVNDLIAPISGHVIEVNDAVVDMPNLPNDDPYEAGWLLRIRPSRMAEFEQLMDPATYAASVGG